MSILNQKTIKAPIEFEGITLHKGKIAKVKILPAKPNSGIVFKRIDIKGDNLIEANFLNVSDFHFYNFPCGRLDEEPIIEIAKVIEKEVQKFEPTTILTHSYNDVHNDHKTIFKATVQATRPVGKIVKNLLSFEILSSTEWNYTKVFKPNLF